MLAAGNHCRENVVGIGHVEVAAKHQSARAPVVAAQEWMCVFHAARPVVLVAQVPHVYLAYKRQAFTPLTRAAVISLPILANIESMAPGAEFALAEYVFMPGSAFRSTTPTRRLPGLGCAVFHQQIQAVEGIGLASVFLW